jgi:hypothetical protein
MMAANAPAATPATSSTAEAAFTDALAIATVEDEIFDLLLERQILLKAETLVKYLRATQDERRARNETLMAATRLLTAHPPAHPPRGHARAARSALKSGATGDP